MRLNTRLQRHSRWIAALGVVLALAGCGHTRQQHHAASVVDFLYPDVKEPVVKSGIPVLSLPLRVGIAFVPSNSYRGDAALTESRKMELLNQVALHFRKYPFVKEIEIIPSAYLRPKGGFSNLDQLRTMYGVDVIALVSYDQVQFTDQGLLSLSYWTIVGAYIVPGEKNDTHTMLDTVVYDIPSRKMLFRAPGVTHIKGRATLVNLGEQLRADRAAGFDGAAKEMVTQLEQQLELFKVRVKERPDEYKVVRQPGYSGGGSIDAAMLALVLFAAGAGWRRSRNRA